MGPFHKSELIDFAVHGKEAVCAAQREPQGDWYSTRLRCVYRVSSNLCKTTSSLTEGQVFLNVVLDEAVEEKAGGERVRLGMVVCF